VPFHRFAPRSGSVVTQNDDEVHDTCRPWKPPLESRVTGAAQDEPFHRTAMALPVEMQNVADEHDTA
jgi:hypothetical protein